MGHCTSEDLHNSLIFERCIEAKYKLSSDLEQRYTYFGL
jgi:hypothetical protein